MKEFKTSISEETASFSLLNQDFENIFDQFLIETGISPTEDSKTLFPALQKWISATEVLLSTGQDVLGSTNYKKEALIAYIKESTENFLNKENEVADVVKQTTENVAQLAIDFNASQKGMEAFRNGKYQDALNDFMEANNYEQAMQVLKRAPQNARLSVNGMRINREKAITDLEEALKSGKVVSFDVPLSSSTDSVGVQYKAESIIKNKEDKESEDDDISTSRFLRRLTKGKLKDFSIIDKDYKITGAEKSALKDLKKALKVFDDETKIKNALHVIRKSYTLRQEPDWNEIGIGIDKKVTSDFANVYGIYK